MTKFLLSSLLFFITTFGFSQTGRISGTIVDSKTGETLPGAMVMIEGTAKGSVTDFDGKFAINAVPVGKVVLVISFISYDTKKITDVNVVANDATDVSVQLEPSTSKDLQEVEVVVTLNKENNTALVLQQKNNASVSDGISAETIKRTPDRNTSDVLKRVSGASIQDNKFAIVRGLNERYNAAYLNGAPLPSSESDRKAFAFDIFPSNMLDNLVITKTARPDMPAEFAGGIIDITTKSIPEKNFVSVSMQGGYNTITTGKEQIYYKGGKKDWLGYDDGTRKRPDIIPAIEDFPYIKSEQANLAKAMPEMDWTTYNKKYSPNASFQVSTGYNIKLKERDFFGVIASVSYNKTNNLIKAVRNSFSDVGTGNPNIPSQLDAIFTDNIYSYQVLAGGLLNLSCKITSNHSISSKNLYSVNSDDRTIVRLGDGALAEANPTQSKTNVFWFTSNKIASSQLIGDHYFPKLKFKINWVGSYSDVKRDVPNLRRNTYGRLKNFSDPSAPNPYDTTWQAVLSPNSVGSDYGGFMFWSSLKENIKSFKLDLTKPLKISEAINLELKTGGQVQQRSRTFEARQFGYTYYGSGFPISFNYNLLLQGPDSIFKNTNMGEMAPGLGGFKLTEGTHPQDSYEASSKLAAGYLMADFKYRKWFRTVLGARVESYNQKLIFPDALYNITKEKIKYDTTVVDVLPSCNLIFSPTDKQNIRLSYSQTLNRPEFRELAPFGFYDFSSLFFTTGNASLKRAKIANYDLRYELYPGRGQLFSSSLFYKDFTNPIEQIALTNVNEISYANVPKAKCYGFELEYRIILGVFMKNDTSFLGKILNNLTLFTNYAYIKSEVDISQQKNKPADAPNLRTLQGQSPYLFNAGLSYIDTDNGFSISAIANRVGQRISVVGNFNSTLDIWESGRTVIDLQASKSFLKNKLEVRFTARDILAKTQIQYFYNKKDYNSKDTRMNRDKDDVIRSIRNGTTFALQVTYKF